MVCLNGNDSVGTFHNRHIYVWQIESHHWPAGFDCDIFADYTAAVINQLFYVCSDLHDVISWLFNPLTSHCHNSLNQRHSCFNRVGNCFCGTDVADHTTHICRKSAARHLSSHHALNQHLLSALRIFGFSHYDIYITDVSSLGLEQLDGIRLVVLDHNETFLSSHCLDDRL